MEAVILTKAGSPFEHLELSKNFPKPQPGKGDLLVKIQATALNPVDWKQAKMGFMIASFPVVIGCDAAGIVEAVGEGVTAFKVGDAVCGHTTIRAGYGSFAQFCLMPEYTAIHKPANWSFEQAATMGVGCQTAAQALFEHLKLPLQAPQGQHTPVLVWGGSGSVGMYAVQLLARGGYNVIATCGSHNHEFVKALGAHHVFDHSDAHVVEKIRQAAHDKLAYAFDTISSHSAALCVKALVHDAPAHLHTIAGKPAEVPANVKVTDGMLAACANNKDAQDFLVSVRAHIEKLAADGMRPNEIEVLHGLAALPEGMKRLSEGKVSGKKLVVTVTH